jgi:O-antigen/teichoic acid export membrane protein
MELFSRSSLIVAGISVLSSVGNVLLAFFGYSIVYLALLNLFLTLCAIIGISLFLKSRFDRIRIFLHFVRDEWYRVFAFGSYLTLSRLYAFSVDPMLRLFVGITFGPVAVAYYAVPSKLLSSINVLFNKVAEVLMPRTARALSARDNESVYRMFLVAMKANLILSTALFLGIAICSRIILRVWVGASFADQGWIVMVPLCFSYMISAQTTIPWTIALGGGLSKLQAGFALLSFLVLSALIYPAANLIGVSGPACAFLASSFLGYFAISRISLRVFGVGTLSLIKGIQSTSLAPVLRGLFR